MLFYILYSSISMIIYIIIALLVAMILAWTCLPTRLLKFTIGGLLTILVALATVQLTLTFTDHLGMRQVTTTSTSQIYSATGKQSPAGILIANRIGKKDNQHQVLVYQDDEDSQARAHFVPNQKHMTESIKRRVKVVPANVDKATLTTKTTRWQWRSERAKQWFNVGQAGELVKEENIVKIPRDTWVVLSTKQMKKMQKLMTNATHDPAQAAQLATLPAHEQAKLTAQMLRQALE